MSKDNREIAKFIKYLTNEGFEILEFSDGVYPSETFYPYVDVACTKANMVEVADRLKASVDSLAGESIWAMQFIVQFEEEDEEEAFEPTIETVYDAVLGKVKVSVLGLRDEILFGKEDEDSYLN